MEHMANCDFTDAEMAHVIKETLNSVLLGEIEGYCALVGVLHTRNSNFRNPEEVSLLVTCLKGITLATSCIHISYHDSLLVAIFKMSMWDYGEDVMDELHALIVSLATSSQNLLHPCLDMLVRNFTPPSSPYFKELMQHPIGLKKKGQVLKRVHEAIIEISNYMPLAPMTLLPLLHKKMPYVGGDESDIVLFVENMLKLESSKVGGVAGGAVLFEVMDRLLELDLLIESSTQKHVEGKTAEKLDSLMVLTFKHLESCAKVGRLTNVFEILLRSFQITVLKACHSQFTQFVMFYACALDPEGCGVTFAEKLADVFVSHHTSVSRMSAVTYLASFLSRGKFLSLSLVSGMLRRLVTWCAEYCKIQNCDINSSAHGPFYSACQAIMYVLCYRMRSMINDPRLKTEHFLMPFKQILKHPLCPLKVCLPTIVQEFLQEAKENGLFIVSEVFDFDDMLKSEFSTGFDGRKKPVMFFPFDPCLLKKSESCIKQYYVHWWMVSGDNDEDEDEIDEGSSDEDEDGVEDDDIDNIFEKRPMPSMPSRIRPSMSPE